MRWEKEDRMISTDCYTYTSWNIGNHEYSVISASGTPEYSFQLLVLHKLAGPQSFQPLVPQVLASTQSFQLLVLQVIALSHSRNSRVPSHFIVWCSTYSRVVSYVIGWYSRYSRVLGHFSFWYSQGLSHSERLVASHWLSTNDGCWFSDDLCNLPCREKYWLEHNSQRVNKGISFVLSIFELHE